MEVQLQVHKSRQAGARKKVIRGPGISLLQSRQTSSEAKQAYSTNGFMQKTVACMYTMCLGRL